LEVDQHEKRVIQFCSLYLSREVSVESIRAQRRLHYPSMGGMPFANAVTGVAKNLSIRVRIIIPLNTR